MGCEGTSIVLIGITGSNESQDYAFLQYTDVTRLIDAVNKTLGCVCLRWNADDGVNYNLRQSTVFSVQGGLSVRE